MSHQITGHGRGRIENGEKNSVAIIFPFSLFFLFFSVDNMDSTIILSDTPLKCLCRKKKILTIRSIFKNLWGLEYSLFWKFSVFGVFNPPKNPNTSFWIFFKLCIELETCLVYFQKKYWSVFLRLSDVFGHFCNGRFFQNYTILVWVWKIKNVGNLQVYVS